MNATSKFHYGGTLNRVVCYSQIEFAETALCRHFYFENDKPAKHDVKELHLLNLWVWRKGKAVLGNDSMEWTPAVDPTRILTTSFSKALAVNTKS